MIFEQIATYITVLNSSTVVSLWRIKKINLYVVKSVTDVEQVFEMEVPIFQLGLPVNFRHSF